jgi:predicted nucleotidyltransferase
MNVAGFEEALESSISLQVRNDLTIRVSSVPGLAVLKLIAWQDRRRENNKDGLDLFRLLEHYAEAGNLDRLYDSQLPLLESAGFDLQLAAAELLGRDASRICHPGTRGQIIALLSSDDLVDQLVRQINQSGFDDDARADQTSVLVSRFRKGFLAG